MPENFEFLETNLDMANIPKTSIFCIIWQWGWFGMVQNTPMVMPAHASMY